MTDTIIKGTGNSRLIKAPPDITNMAPDHAALLSLLISGLPVDISGPVAAGCDVVGTALNKAFFNKLICLETGSYAGASLGQEYDVTLKFSVHPVLVVIVQREDGPNIGYGSGSCIAWIDTKSTHAIYAYNNHFGESFDVTVKDRSISWRGNRYYMNLLGSLYDYFAFSIPDV